MLARLRDNGGTVTRTWMDNRFSHSTTRTIVRKRRKQQPHDRWKTPADILSTLPQTNRNIVNVIKRYLRAETTHVTIWFHEVIRHDHDHTSRFRFPHLHLIHRQESTNQEYTIPYHDRPYIDTKEQLQQQGGTVHYSYVRTLPALHRYLNTPPCHYLGTNDDDLLQLFTEYYSLQDEIDAKDEHYNDDDEESPPCSPVQPRLYSHTDMTRDTQLLKESQHDITARIVRFLMITTRKHDYETINSHIQLLRPSHPNIYDAWSRIMKKPNLHTVIDRTRDQLKVIYKDIPLISLAYNWIRYHQTQPSSTTSYMTLTETADLFHRWFQHNSINPYEFIRSIIAIYDKRTAKRNCFFVNGESNSGKTLLITNTLHAITPFPALISTIASSNESMWMPILGARAVFANN